MCSPRDWDSDRKKAHESSCDYCKTDISSVASKQNKNTIFFIMNGNFYKGRKSDSWWNMENTAFGRRAHDRSDVAKSFVT